MQKRLIILILMMCISILSVSAQDEDSTFRVWSPIDSVSAEYTEVSTDEGDLLALELTIAGHHTDACELELLNEMVEFENNLDIQVYRELSPAMSCLRDDTPFETKIVLETTLADLPPYLTINDQVWQVTVPDGDSVSTDDLPTFTELTLVNATIDEVTATLLEGDDPLLLLDIVGSAGVGCDVPLVYRVRELADLTVIGVFNPIEELAVCPAMLIILDETIEIPATLIEDDTLVTVNETLIDEVETQTMSDSNKVMTNINTVTVNVMESSPMQISLSVSGEHPDGCELPVVVDQSRDGNTIDVEIYREVPADMMCPMMLNPYEATFNLTGTFDSGSYTITVNGVTQSVDI